MGKSYSLTNSRVERYLDLIHGDPNQTNVFVLRSTYQRKPKDYIVWADYRSGPSLAVGIIQLALSVVSVLCNVMAIIVFEEAIEDGAIHTNNPFIIGYGIWPAVFYVASGSVAVAAAKRKIHHKIRALLGVSVVSCLMGLIEASMAIASMVSDSVGYAPDYQEVLYAMCAVMLLAGLVSASSSIYLAKISGDHVCCNEEA